MIHEKFNIGINFFKHKIPHFPKSKFKNKILTIETSNFFSRKNTRQISVQEPSRKNLYSG